jgi:choline dehydrogenase
MKMPRTSPDLFDVIIIGGGSAGSVMASRLSENPKVRVLLLEAGGWDHSPLLRVPGAVRFTIGSKKYDWNIVSEPDPTRYGNVDAWSRGKVLGGSSAINGMVYHRGCAADYDALADGFLPGWDYQSVLPYYKRIESYIGGDDAEHGRSGAQPVEPLRTPHFMTTKFLEACNASGIDVASDTNDGRMDTVGYVHTTQHNGARVSAAMSYLPRAVRARPNLSIKTGAHVNRIVMAGRRATGVEVEIAGVRQNFSAGHVVMAAGSVMTPHILTHSGIGDPAVLQNLGLRQIIAQPQIGQHLQDHVEAGLTYEVNASTYNMKVDILNMAKYGLRWLLRRDGPVASPGAQATGVLRSRRELNRPDLQLYFQPAGYRLEPGKIIFNREPSVQFTASLTNPKSRGYLEFASPDPRVVPKLHPRLLGDPEDMAKLVQVAHTGRRIMRSAPMAPYVVRELEPGDEVTEDADIEAVLRRIAEPLLHIAGTCRMGRGEDDPVDMQFRLRGADNIYVADMSILPELIACNTNAFAMMIGERAAEHIAKDLAA